jgi:hypothetical protein
MIRGMLHTGGNPLYLAAHLIAGQGWRTELYEQPPWAPGEELVTAELGPYLRGLESAAPPIPASD